MMATDVYFSLAHKGGTGRSVASINLAYHMTKAGSRVALLDLDIGAATLHHICRPLGAVEKKKGPRDAAYTDDGLKKVFTLTDYLRRSGDLRHVHYIDLYTKGKPLNHSLTKGSQTFRLYPGTPNPESLSTDSDVLMDRLNSMMEYLVNDGFYVICDVRAGVTELLELLLQATAGNSQLRPHWIVFMRKTPQHVAGARALLEALHTGRRDSPYSKLRLVPTAVHEFRDADQLGRTHKGLQSFAKQMLTKMRTDIQTLKEMYAIDDTALELRFATALQWDEGVVMQKNGIADYYYSDVSALAARLVTP